MSRELWVENRAEHRSTLLTSDPHTIVMPARLVLPPWSLVTSAWSSESAFGGLAVGAVHCWSLTTVTSGALEVHAWRDRIACGVTSGAPSRQEATRVPAVRMRGTEGVTPLSR